MQVFNCTWVNLDQSMYAYFGLHKRTYINNYMAGPAKVNQVTILFCFIVTDDLFKPLL